MILGSFLCSCQPSGKENSATLVLDNSENSLMKIHRITLLPSCAVAGCHDGHFEPDFRTTQSTYYTTVLHPVTKNNARAEFEFRVVPGNRKKSVLYERITNCCFVNQDDRMPQLNIGEVLPNEEIERIGKWIDAGAPNIDGSKPWEKK